MQMYYANVCKSIMQMYANINKAVRSYFEVDGRSVS